MPQTDIRVDELCDLLEQDQPVTVLDIRRAKERAEWSIPGSLHLDVYDRLGAKEAHVMDPVQLPTGEPVVIVCVAGETSQLAAQQLRERGVTALSLVGGMRAWSLAWNTAQVPLAHSAASVIQVRRTGKGCLSYLIGNGREAVVIDASLDPSVYMAIAEQHGWQIKAVCETHVHADHLSRARKLAEVTSALLCLPDNQRVSFPFHTLHDGDGIPVGAARLETLHTPGHTLESSSYLLDREALFSGDTLFLASVGRPDLEAGIGEASAHAHHLYHSLQRLSALPDDTFVLPGHTSEPVPFDHRPLTATLAEVHQRLQILNQPEDDFVQTVIARIPATPPNHSRIIGYNEAGQLPDGDLGELEAGANRCAIANP